MDKLSEQSQRIFLDQIDQLDDIKKLYLAGLFDEEFISNEAARKGNIELVKWLVDQGVKLTVKMAASACLSGNLDLVKYLYTKQTQNNKKKHDTKEIFNWTACAWAGLGGHLDIIKFLRKNKCPWNKWTTANAARHNHREFLDWAIENGCKLTEDTAIFAAVGGHVNLLHYLTFEFEGIVDLDTVRKIALKHNQMDVIEWCDELL